MQKLSAGRGSLRHRELIFGRGYAGAPAPYGVTRVSGHCLLSTTEPVTDDIEPVGESVRDLPLTQ